MDFDLFFSSPRWRILEILAKKPSAPVEISQKVNTSVAYVSQQLKLLEAGNIVTKKRTGSVEKGKPRMVFSLTEEILQLTVLMNGLPARKVIKLSEHHKTILRIWLLEDPDLHKDVEKIYWKLEEELGSVDGIFVDTSHVKPKVLIISGSKKVSSIINSILKDSNKIALVTTTEQELEKIPLEKIHPIYDPKGKILGKELKGGTKKEDDIQ